MCREDDYEDEPEPSLLETLVKKAQEMARSIRMIKHYHVRTKADKLKDTVSSPTKPKKLQLSPKAVKESKFGSIKLKNQNTFEDSDLDLIKQKFDSYESPTDQDSKNFDEFSPMKKTVSNTVSSFAMKVDEFNFDNPAKYPIRRRDRAQSENDTELIFNCEKASNNPKKFVQKHHASSDSSDEEKKHESSSEAEIEGVKKSDPEASDDEDDTNETSRSPPIKRTMSLPRIKILEKQSSLPRIREVNEDEADEDMLKKTSATTGTGTTETDISPLNFSAKPRFSVSKITRQHSEEIRENKLKDSPYDEDFFYYLDLYLGEAIKKIASKNNKLVLIRNRSFSEAM